MRTTFFLILIPAMVACGGRSPIAVPGSTEVGVTFTRSINEVTGNDRSGPDESKYDPINSNTRGYLGVSTCGTLGLIYRKVVDDGGFKQGMAYYGVDADGTGTESLLGEMQNGSSLEFNWSLVFDGDCAPHVYQAGDGGYRHWSMEGSAWTSEDLDLGLETVLGESPDSLTHLFGERAPDGNIHLIFETWVDGGRRLLHAVESGGTWTVDSIPTLQDTMPDPDMKNFLWRFYDFAVDSSGGVHVGFNWDRHLYYGKLEGGTWRTEAVRQRDNFDQEAAVTASLALDPGGRPHIAATFAQRATTGSWRYMDLRYYQRLADGSWSGEILVTQADGYVGGDGNRFTGYDPHLVFDGQGRAHIVFNDVSSWHFWLTDDFDPESVHANDHIFGQLRYLFHNGAGWEWYTLVSQPGQNESPQPLHDMPNPTIAVSADGGTLAFAAVERLIQGTTFRFDTMVEMTYKMVVTRATNAIGGN